MQKWTQQGFGQPTTHNLICGEGRYRGTRYTRLPLHELKKQSRGAGVFARLAISELERRGHLRTSEDIDISLHAINRISQRFIRHFLDDAADTGEGIVQWLTRISSEALKMASPEETDICYRGMTLAFERSGLYPLLKTVY